MLSFVTLSGGSEGNVECSWSQAMGGEAGSAPAAQGRWNWLLRITSEVELELCVKCDLSLAPSC